MTADEDRARLTTGHGQGAGAPRTIRQISDAQAEYMLANLRDPVVYPPPRDQDPNGSVEFIYPRHLLTPEQDLEHVLHALHRPGISPSHQGDGGPNGEVE